MNGISKIAIIILVTNAFVFVSCSKEDERTSNNYASTQPPPPPPAPPNMGKTIKARIVEYNSGIPISGATVSLRPDYPNMNTITLTSDQTGAISFISSTSNIGYISVGKSGYWSLAPYSDLAAPVFFYPDTTQLSHFINGNAITCDSFVVKLFRVWNIPVHIKDTSGSEEIQGLPFMACIMLVVLTTNATEIGQFSTLVLILLSWCLYLLMLTTNSASGKAMMMNILYGMRSGTKFNSYLMVVILQ